VFIGKWKGEVDVAIKTIRDTGHMDDYDIIEEAKLMM
jgi:hypothetical protein